MRDVLTLSSGGDGAQGQADRVQAKENAIETTINDYAEHYWNKKTLKN